MLACRFCIEPKARAQPMDKARFNQDLLDFLQNAPSPFHATARMVDRLEAAGFQPLQEEDDWSLAAEGQILCHPPGLCSDCIYSGATAG